jgi:ribonuclease BN (tRNA processing enzyme)
MSDSITFLGTSDGLPSADRHHASLLLRLGGQTILLDAGEPCSHTLKQAGFDFNSLDAIVVTHAHSDHIGGLPMLVQSCWLEQRSRPLPVYLPPGIIQPLRVWLHACFLFEELFPFALQLKPLTDSSFRVYPTTHLEHTRREFEGKHPQVRFEAFAVAFESGHKRVGYSGDLGGPEDLTPLFPLDLLVCELAHFHPQELANFLKNKSLKRLVLTHLGRPIRARLAEVQRILPDAIFTTDGDTIQV